MSGLVDEFGEYRLLGTIIDRPDTVLSYGSELFTGDRVSLFRAFKDAYLAYGDISSEGVERFYGRMLPPELEISRGASPNAVLHKLEDLATKRQLGALQEQIALLLNSNTHLNRDDVSKRLTLNPIVAREDSTVGQGVTSFIADFTRKKEGKYRFAQTGLRFLDHMLGGEWSRQGLTVIAGQSGGGKTALVVNSILNMARLGLPSLFISLEMPKDRIIGRMVANISGVNGMDIRTGNVSDDDQVRIDAALEEIQSLEKYIFIVDRPAMTVEDIVYQVRLHKENYNIDAFFVDYIQIVDRNMERDVEALGQVAQQLRKAAVNLDISAIVLSQQNSNDGLESIWGSRRIVHVADSIFAIELDKNVTGDDQRMCTLNFMKNRDGAVGQANCLYFPKFLRFA